MTRSDETEESTDQVWRCHYCTEEVGTDGGEPDQDCPVCGNRDWRSLVTDGGREESTDESPQLSAVDAAVYDLVDRREPAHADEVFDELARYSRDEFDLALIGLKRDGLVVEVEESLPFHEDASRTLVATEGYDGE